MEPVLLTVLLAGFVSMDTTAGPQVLVSEPLVSCTVAGFLFGDPVTGLMLGIMFQMLWIGYLPLGAVHFTDNNMGALIGTASLLAAQKRYGLSVDMTTAAMILAVLFGIWVSLFGMHIRNVVRRLNGIRSERFFDAYERGETPSVMQAHIMGTALSFLKGMSMALPGIPLGMLLCGVVRLLSHDAVAGISSATPMFAGALSATAILFYWDRNRHHAVVLGALAGIVWTIQAIR